jgi:hypothetical protein
VNNDLIVALLNRVRSMDPPGCASDFVELPFPPYRKRQAVEVGIMIEHRFAFYYWLKCKQMLQKNRYTNERVEDEVFVPPDLVTWDWHNDVAVPSDFIESELIQLNQTDEEEVALFCWAGLRQLNDGHILPALWLNALGNVYVIQKQHQDCRSENYSCVDRFGNEHHVLYFRSLKDFPGTFERTNSHAGVIWDVDMDYFTQGRSVADQCYTPSLSGDKISAMLLPTTPWMPLILRDLKAITLALEPQYTGGLSKSLELYRHWESAPFALPLFNKNCRWRNGIMAAIS